MQIRTRNTTGVLGTEARALDERTRPQRTFDLFFARQIAQAERTLKSFPDISPEWTTEQVRTQWESFRRQAGPISFFDAASALPAAYAMTIIWALTILALALTEILGLFWLAGHHPDSGDWPILAWLSVLSTSMGMILLLAVPILRLLWFQIPTATNLKAPESFYELIEQKFGLPADSSEDARSRWLAMMNEQPREE